MALYRGICSTSIALQSKVLTVSRKVVKTGLSVLLPPSVLVTSAFKANRGVKIAAN